MIWRTDGPLPGAWLMQRADVTRASPETIAGLVRGQRAIESRHWLPGPCAAAREFQANAAELSPGARRQLTPSSLFRPEGASRSFSVN